jgi:hypothetical protein
VRVCGPKLKLSIFTAAVAAPALSESAAVAAASITIHSNIAIIAGSAKLTSPKCFLFIVLLPFEGLF